MASPRVTYIEDETLRNTNYRQVIYTGKFQLVLMSLMPGEDIPEEIHRKLDQFIQVVSGEGFVTLWKNDFSGDSDDYTLEERVSVFIPAGIRHYIKNTDSENPLKLYTIYSRPEHSPNRIDEEKPSESRHRSRDIIKVPASKFASSPLVMYIEDKTLSNVDYLRVMYSGKSQLVLMSLMPEEYIPTEVHLKVDKFIQVESGEGILTIGEGKFSEDYTLEERVSSIIPAGTKHHIKNTDVDNPLKLYVMYSKPVHSSDLSDGFKKWDSDEALRFSMDRGVTPEFIEQHISQDWDWDELSENPKITPEFVDIHSNEDWNWRKLSELINITPEFIRSHIDEDWDWDQLSRNPNITLEFILDHPDKDWNWFRLTNHPKMTLEFIEAHPEKIWNWFGLSSNPKITPEFLERHINEHWDWNTLSFNKNITPEFIDYRSGRFWNWIRLSGNPNITPEFIEGHLDKNWDWTELSRNQNITPEFIEDHLDKNWDWTELSGNPNITPEFIGDHLDKNWDWSELSGNPNITPEFFNLLDDKDWDPIKLRRNPKFTSEFWMWKNHNSSLQFMSHRINDRNWRLDPREISKNPNITPKFIESQKFFEWYWKEIVKNPSITPELVQTRANQKFWKPYWVELRLKQPLIKPAQR